MPLVCLFLLFQAAAGRCDTNLEQKTKYEKALEQKVEEVLVNLLGPNKAKVMIQVDVDFSVKENVSGAGGKSADNQSAFKWQNINSASDAPQQELLPGFPVESRLNMAADTSSQRELVFPQSMINRITVSLVLSDTVSDKDALKVRQVIENLLGVNAKRGDQIMMVRARFAPLWYTPEMINILVKYGIVAIIAILGMCIVTIGFLKMAGAMNNMAGAGQQKISMDMAGGGGGMGGGGDPALGLPEPGAKGKGDAEVVPEIENAIENVIFNVPPEKVNVLVHMLSKESPADIALVAVHLDPALRSRFVSAFPPEKGAQVIASISKVRFIDPDMIIKIKEELERRLSGAVGGYDKVLELMSSVDVKAKKALYDNLLKNYPDVAARVRPSIIFLDDIEKLSGKDLSILMGTIAVDQLGLLFWRLSESAKPKLRAQMADRTWQMVEQTMKYGKPPEEKIDKAVEALIASIWKLIGAGRINNPNIETPAEITYISPQAGAHQAVPAGAAPEVKKAGDAA